VQRGLTAAMRKAAEAAGDVQRMQAWAGQGASFARAVPAQQLLADTWAGARRLLET
jgi:nitronate monooxygenase